ncbi:MAG: response regulator transcription factor [Campylobacterales bacterium]|nr:response regulator transcription factor [Campylobacterales bacterium]
MNLETMYEQTKHLSVLFVEDDALLRVRIVEILEEYFHRVDFATDGIDALEKFKHFHEVKNTYYDLVISDIQMPRMDGVQLTAQLYALRKEQPIVIISAHADIEHLIALINLGVAQFITKPIQYQQMLETLYAVSLKMNSEPKKSIQPPHIISLDEHVVWDKKKQLLLCDEVSISLTKYEIYLMIVLILKFEQVCSTDEILNHFFLHEIDISSESLRGMMMRLRKKLPENTLTSIYGLGYRLSGV